MNGTLPIQPSDAKIEHLLQALDSLTEGDLAVDLLVACGKPAIAPLKQFLIHGPARTIALPRCRAVRVLGGLQARKALLEYFEKFDLPGDPAVLFAEDAVRSAVAHELLRWKSDEVFEVLLEAAKQRATMGLIESLGEFCRTETIPLMFQILEDDLCRGAAFAALTKMPGESRSYAVLSLRGETGANLEGAAASRRRRATAELIRNLGISSKEWRDVSPLLADEDPTVVICIAAAGFRAAPDEEFPRIVQALLRTAHKLNWLQEDEVIHLLDEHKTLAREAAKRAMAALKARGEEVNWLSPMWRILQHLERAEYSARPAIQNHFHST